MKTPIVSINIKGIEENAKLMKNRLANNNIKLTGVIKGAAGDLKVAEAFIRGGIESIGDSRLKNIINLRNTGFDKEIILLRLPDPEEAEEVVKYADLSLVSEIKTIKALSRAAMKLNKIHKVIVMVDVGDLREGVLPEDLEEFFAEILNFNDIEIKGLGTNVGCYGGVLPSYENTKILLELRDKLENKYKIKLPVISGGNTATTVLLEDNALAEGVNNFRVGEAILQGTDVTNQRMISWLNQNNFVLTASIIELKNKPSVPMGNIGRDAFGNIPKFLDKGIRKRAILAIGRQDVKIDGLTPLIKGAEIIGASSDHLLLDLTDVSKKLSPGDKISFNLDYGAMLSVMTSSYVYKKYEE
jgi:ornithine racemase